MAILVPLNIYRALVSLLCMIDEEHILPLIPPHSWSHMGWTIRLCLLFLLFSPLPTPTLSPGKVRRTTINLVDRVSAQYAGAALHGSNQAMEELSLGAKMHPAMSEN